MAFVTFTHPEFLWFLFAVPCLLILHLFTLRYVKVKALKFSNFEAIAKVSRELVVGPYRGLFMNRNLGLLFLRTAALLALIFSVVGTVVWYEGGESDFDFVLAIDTSSSMLADDFEPYRLAAAKEAALGFVDRLEGRTQLGIVTFAGVSAVEQQLTDDLAAAREKILGIEINNVGGTNLGDAIITASNIFSNSSKAKVIILLTDGQSNVGTPLEKAIRYANDNEIIVHTIGVGTDSGGKLGTINATFKLDTASLEEIAERTNGMFFRAEHKSALEESYREIASVNTRTLSTNISFLLLLISLVLLLIEWFLVNTRYRTIP